MSNVTNLLNQRSSRYQGLEAIERLLEPSVFKQLRFIIDYLGYFTSDSYAI